MPLACLKYVNAAKNKKLFTFKNRNENTAFNLLGKKPRENPN